MPIGFGVKMMKMKLDIPQHVGLIIDGNRRWAKKHGLPVWEGHLAGVTALEDVLRELVERGVKYISFYTWSTENWDRAEEEVSAFMKLLKRMFKTELKQLLAEDCRLVMLGDRETLPKDLKVMIEKAEQDSIHNDRALFVMCFNYGGQREIAHAARAMMKAGVDPDMVDEYEFAKYLDHPDIPPCDVVVRTSGEKRLSNFMLWRSAYSEFIFLDKLWPDMRKEDVAGIIEEYNKRSRRYGG